MEVRNAAMEKELKEVVVDIEKESKVSEPMWETPLKPSLMSPLPFDESDPDFLISFVNQSSMTTSEAMKEWDGLSFDLKTPEGWQL